MPLHPLRAKCLLAPWAAGFCALLVGCAGAPDTPVGLAGVPAASFAIGPAATADALTEGTGTRDLPPVRLYGRAVVPTTLSGVANVNDGSVSGSQVLVTDAMSGRQLAHAVTYYDGSFSADVPLKDGARAVLVSVQLVDKQSPDKTSVLMAPLVVRAGMPEQQVTLTPGSTAFVTFLNNLAAEQAGLQPADDPVPGLPSPGVTSAQLSSLIAIVDDDTQNKFAQLAEASPELTGPQSLASLQSGIQHYVGRLLRNQIKVVRK